MAVIPVLDLSESAQNSVIPLDLSTGPHTWSYKNGSFTLLVSNGDVASITVNILGAGVTAHDCANVGSIDLSSGKDITCVNGEVTSVQLNQISAYFGDIGNEVTFTITGATSLSTAYIAKV